MSSSKWQAVVFDLDDTLFPEAAYVYSGFKAAALCAEEQLGFGAAETLCELTDLYAAGVRGNTFARWAEAHGQSVETVVPLLVLAYRNHEPQLTPFPEAVSLLQMLRPLACLGLVSDGWLAVQRRKLAALKIDTLFDVVAFSDTWGRDAWKPNPLPYQRALAAMHVLPQFAVYIGDNPVKDFLGARRAGMRSIRLRLTQGEYAALEPLSPCAAPDYEETSFAALQHLLLT